MKIRLKKNKFIRTGSAVTLSREEALGGSVVSPDSDQTSLATTSPSSLASHSGFLSRISVVPFVSRGYSSGLIFSKSEGIMYQQQKIKTWRWLFLAVAILALAGKAKAASSANIDIHVSVN